MLASRVKASLVLPGVKLANRLTCDLKRCHFQTRVIMQTILRHPRTREVTVILRIGSLIAVFRSTTLRVVQLRTLRH